MRTVPLSVLFKLIKEKPISLVGLLFVFGALFFMFPLLLVLMPQLKTDQDRYDYDAISQRGEIVTATVRDLQQLRNVTVNGQHPLRIGYDYPANGALKQDVFQTFDLDKARRLEVGDTVTVRSYQGQSAIVGLENFRFPYFLFFLIPVVFVLIGTPFLFFGMLPVWKKFNLYRSGIPRKGTLVAMTPKTSRYARHANPHVSVDYYFTGTGGERVFGNASTADFSILNEKKSGDDLKLLVSEDEKNSCLVPQLENLKYHWGL